MARRISSDLVRRLQEYERFKTAAESIERIPRMDRDTWVASADLTERKSSRPLPQIAMQEMLLAFAFGCSLFLAFWDLDNWMLVGSLLMLVGLVAGRRGDSA